MSSSAVASDSPSCRILVLSQNPSESKNLVEQIIAKSETAPDNHYNTFEEDENDDRIGNEGYLINWTIDNKYYTAGVHFFIQPLALPPAKPLWPPEEDDDQVPVVIFVYVDGQPYRETFLSLIKAIQAHDPEVSLAVRVIDPNDTEEAEDPDVAMEFFAEHGFELVEINLDEEAEQSSQDNPDSDPFDVVGVPRIINTLSTVMWPSMTRKERRSSKSYLPTPGSLISRAILEAQGEENELNPDAGELLLSGPSVRDSSAFEPDVDPNDAEALQSLFASLDGAIADRDLEKLQAWLDADHEAPWQSNSVSAPQRAPPEATDGRGFDDDFSDFVSAPPPPGGTTEAGGKDSEDFPMPSQTDIELTAKRIFGTSLHSSAPFDPDTGEPAAKGQERSDQDEAFKFDLAEVLGALQAMKEEVGEISDMDQRRKAAARVALAFASGLGLSEKDL